MSSWSNSWWQMFCMIFARGSKVLYTLHRNDHKTRFSSQKAQDRALIDPCFGMYTLRPT